MVLMDWGQKKAYTCGRLSMLGGLPWIEKYYFFHPEF
jgi:hypothetical protein